MKRAFVQSFVCFVFLISLCNAVARRELVIAHRGDSEFAPENTMGSFQQAVDKNTDGIETDLRLTSDGHIVLFHDATVDRTTNGTGLVANMTLAEIQSLDAGSWFGPEWKGQRVPSLAEFLDWIEGDGSSVMLIVLDLKVDGLGPHLSKLLVNYNVTDRLIASCWTDEQAYDIRTSLNGSMSIQRLRKAIPDISDDSYFTQAIIQGVKGFSLSYVNLSSEFVKEAHAHLLSVVVWTVQPSSNDMSQIAALGIDGIITNDVAGSIKALEASESPEPSYVGLKDGYVVLIAIMCSVAGILIGVFATYLFVHKRIRYNTLPE